MLPPRRQLVPATIMRKIERIVMKQMEKSVKLDRFLSSSIRAQLKFSSSHTDTERERERDLELCRGSGPWNRVV